MSMIQLRVPMDQLNDIADGKYSRALIDEANRMRNKLRVGLAVSEAIRGNADDLYGALLQVNNCLSELPHEVADEVRRVIQQTRADIDIARHKAFQKVMSNGVEG